MQAPSGLVALQEQPLDCCISPTSSLIAAGLVNGVLQLVAFDEPTAAGRPDAEHGGDGQDAGAAGAGAPATVINHRHVRSIPAPSSVPGSADDGGAPSCRAVRFMPDGQRLLAGFSDACVRVYDASTSGRALTTLEGAHGAAVSRLLCIDDNLFASGDEAGEVKVWDLRLPPTAKEVYRSAKHTDYITDMVLHPKDGALIVASGDGTLSVHDVKARKCRSRTEDDADDELLAIAVVKGGKKLVAGTQSGVLNLYSWGAMKDCSDRFPGHPESVQSVLAWDTDTLLTGSSDGAVRIVAVLPNRLLGVLGEQPGGLPVERLALSACRRVLVSTGHEPSLALWDLSLLHDDDDDDGEGNGQEGQGVEQDEEGLGVGGGSDGEGGGGGEEEDVGDLGGEDEDEDEEEDEDGEGEDGQLGSAGGSDDDGSGDGEDEGEDAAAAQGQAEQRRASGSAVAGPSQEQAKVQAAASKPKQQGGLATLRAAMKGAAAGGAEGGSEEGAEGDGNSDSDSDGGKPKKKRQKGEKTRWTSGREQTKRGSGGNFFADLL